MDSQVGVEVSSLITWLIVAVGWYIVNNQNNNRETRKEHYQEIGKLIELIQQTENLATSFHTSDEFDPKNNAQIIRNLNKISLLLSGIHYLKAIHLAPFRKSITFKNFEKSQFKKYDALAPELLEIMSESDELTKTIKQLYQQHYGALN